MLSLSLLCRLRFCTGQQKEIASQEKQFKTLQQELLKLNALIARNRGVQEDLQSTNVLMQNEFTRQLKAEERETVQLQTQIEDLHNERERLLNAVIEAERQLLLWEKKIQLVKVCVCVCVTSLLLHVTHHF